MKILVFDIWGEYAHFKKIYATTSALSYAIPPKPTIYGIIGAILGLEKDNNEYLKSFSDKACLIGIQYVAKREKEDNRPLTFQRMGINLKAELGRKKEGSPPKPTMMEFVYRPRYRLYVSHSDNTFFEKLKVALESHTSVYTPSLGLASLIANYEYKGVFNTEGVSSSNTVSVHSVIPRKDFMAFDDAMFTENADFAIVEQSLYAVEMDTQRNVTERDDILLERKGNPILAKVKTYYPINGENICLF
jgi:CRISPR-associated protein Cas5h